MKFQLGNISESANLNIKDGWKLINKPKLWHWQLQAFPVAIINIVTVSILWIFFTPAGNQLDKIPIPIPILGFVLSLIGVLCLHEFIHAISHPSIGFSQSSVIGFWPPKMLVYAIYNGVLSKTRFIIILLTPFIVISILPIIVAIMSNYYNFWLAYITILNAFVSAGDILEVITLINQTPNRIRIERDGWDYYWKLL